MKPEELPYKSTFSSYLKPIVSQEKDKYLALASLENVRAFLPEIGIGNDDLLPVAFNACVINRVNKNDDVIDTETAVAFYKSFMYKQINLGHNRKNVVGVVLTAGFTEFGTDKPMTEEQALASTGPFNIALGGVIWRVVNGGLADFIEDSNDPTSENFMKISASWEIGFSDYRLAILNNGEKNLEDARIISEASEIEKLKENLKALKGNGKLDSLERIYRVPSHDVIALGIGLTENPAAEVSGVATPNIVSKEEELPKNEEASEEVIEETEAPKEAEASVNKEDIKNIISQPEIPNVNIERIQDMNIKTLKDITDDNLKQCSAATIAEVVQNHLSEKALEYEAQKGKLQDQLKSAEELAAKASSDTDALQKKLEQVQAAVEQLTNEKLEKEKVEQFDARMSEISASYDLDDEARLVLVEEIKAIASEEAFAAWKKKASVLLKGFAKKAPPFVKKGEEKEGDEKEAAKEGETKNMEKKEKACASELEKAMDNGKEEKGGLPNTSDLGERTKSILEKYKTCLARENFIITQ